MGRYPGGLLVTIEIYMGRIPAGRIASAARIQDMADNMSARLGGTQQSHVPGSAYAIPLPNTTSSSTCCNSQMLPKGENWAQSDDIKQAV